jgi:protoheme IX farnesyltransferase
MRGSILELLKPGIAFSVLWTVVPGLLTGSHIPHWGLFLAALLGTLLVAMSSFVFNQILEVKTDALMERTRNRPLLTGKITRTQAHILGAGLLTLGMSILWLFTTPLAALISLFSFLYYIFIYTLLLKPRTVQSTVLGGVCGAIGPLIGQAAVIGRIEISGALLFLLLFLWQPPHFWALAIARRDEYGKANFPLLPVLHGVPRTLKNMVFYQILLVAATVLAWIPLAVAGLAFLIPSLICGLVTLVLIFRLDSKGEPGPAMRVFFASIVHNLLWHAAFAVDRFLVLSA